MDLLLAILGPVRRISLSRSNDQQPPFTKMSQYALFGATGTVGSAILATLLRPAGKAHVTALVRTPSKLPADLKSDSRLTVVEGDMDNVDAIRKVVGAGKDGVIAALNEQDVNIRLRQFGYLVKVGSGKGTGDICWTVL